MQRRSGQRSALERRAWQLIDDIREALRLGEPGAIDAIDQLELGARALRRDNKVLWKTPTVTARPTTRARFPAMLRLRAFAERHEIASRYAEWEIIGPPELRR